MERDMIFAGSPPNVHETVDDVVICSQSYHATLSFNPAWTRDEHRILMYPRQRERMGPSMPIESIESIGQSPHLVWITANALHLQLSPEPSDRVEACR